MNGFKQSNYDEARQNLQVWCCDGCQAVHFKADKVSLNFTKAEFADLAHAVMEIYRQQFGSLEFYDLIGSLKQRDEILISQAVA